MKLLPVAVVPVIIGPLQVLVTLLPALLLSLAGALLSLRSPTTMWALVKLLWRQKIALTILAASVIGAVFLARTLTSQGGPTGEQVAGADWPMFRGGLERRGSNDATKPPSAGGINWKYADVKTFYASPAVVGNRVYVSSAEKTVFSDRGAIYCLDADTGACDWKSAPSGYLATFSSPSIAGTYLVCGEGLHLTKTARVICMDISQRGKILWTYETKSHVESTPCIDIDKGRVYVGAGDDGYYCFRLAPDADGKAQVVWHTPPGRCPDAETSPAVHDGRVFVGLGMGGNALVCLNGDTGEEVWRVNTPYPVFGPPTVVNGLVLVGMGNGNFIQTADEVRQAELDKLRAQGKSEAEIADAGKRLGAAGEVWCVQEKTGEIQWKFKAADVILGAVAADRERLFFGSRDGYLYSLSLSGKLLEKWNANAPILTSPVVCGDQVYVVTEPGMLYGLRAADLERFWEARLGFTGPFVSSPAVAHGHVYVGSQDDGLLCLGKPGGQEREACWAGYAGGSGCGGNVDGQPLPEKGKFSWRFPDTEYADPKLAPEIAAPAACLDGVLYVPLEGGRKGLVCLREATDSKGVRGEEVWFVPATNGVRISPAAASKNVFFVDGQKGDAGRQLRCLAAGDGQERWKRPVESEASGAFVLTDEGALIADGPGRLTAFSTSGEVLWRVDSGEVCGMPATSEAFVVIATERPAGLSVLDRLSGHTLWRIPLESPAKAAPVVRKNVIYLGTSAGVVARGLTDGKLLWEAPCGEPGAPLVIAKNRLACTTAGGTLVVIDLVSGRVESTISDVVPGIPPLLVGELIVYAGKSGLLSCPATGGDSQLWMKTGWLGQVTCALVMAESRIYMATDKKGLVCLKGR